MALPLILSTVGCLSSLQKHSTTLSAATAPVVESAAAAYHAAQALQDTRVDFDAVTEFDQESPVYNPRTIQPLLGEDDVEIRLAVLAAFQCYTQSLVDITYGINSPGLTAASKSAGSNLSAVGNTLAPSVEKTFGIATASGAATQTTITTVSGNSTTSKTTTSHAAPPPPITPEMRNGISTAVQALGQFLVSRKIRKQLPQRIIEMDPHLQALCSLIERDLDLLQYQAERDYNSIINRQTLFIRASSTLQPQQRREEIMKLPEIVRQQRATEEQLADLRGSIQRLASVHHALALDAQGGHPESLKTRMSELEAAGNDLGKYYASLPTKD